MSLVITVLNGDATMVWTVVGPSAKIIDTLNDAGKYWYDLWYKDDGPEWETLTNPEKRAILNQALKNVVKTTAAKLYVDSQLDTAQDVAEAEADDRYELNEP